MHIWRKHLHLFGTFCRYILGLSYYFTNALTQNTKIRN